MNYTPKTEPKYEDYFSFITTLFNTKERIVIGSALSSCGSFDSDIDSLMKKFFTDQNEPCHCVELTHSTWDYFLREDPDFEFKSEKSNSDHCPPWNGSEIRYKNERNSSWKTLSSDLVVTVSRYDDILTFESDHEEWSLDKKAKLELFEQDMKGFNSISDKMYAFLIKDVRKDENFMKNVELIILEYNNARL